MLNDCYVYSNNVKWLLRLLQQISKFGHPNGIVRFDGAAQLAREVQEPDGTSTLTLQFPILRRQDTGTVGNIEVSG